MSVKTIFESHCFPLGDNSLLPNYKFTTKPHSPTPFPKEKGAITFLNFASNSIFPTFSTKILNLHFGFPLGGWSAFLFVFLVISCQKQVEKIPDNVFYTCSMDPQIMEKKPGKCPICKMDLTKITVDQNQSNSLKLSDEQIELANIKLDKVVYGNMGTEKIINAQLTANENRTFDINSRVAGRIEKLYFKNIGDHINAGQVMYEIYSEDFLSAQREFITAIQQAKEENQNEDAKRMISSARNKLLLWGMSTKQVSDLESTKELKAITPIYSNLSGTVTKLNIKEGDYVLEGGNTFELTDFSTLWAEAQLYAGEIQAISIGQEVTVRVESYPDQLIKGKISFINPQLSTQSKVNIVRVEILNPKGMLKPGMQANVIVNENAHRMLLVNSNAVLQDAKGATVWIKLPDGSFSIKMVTIGIQNGDQTEIIKGLKEGDEVVVSGVYLLNSEYVFKKGANPMEGHDMSKM